MSRTRSAGWLDRPQQTRLRKLLFKVHLWIGIAVGVYVVVISVSGSAAVFRRELNIWLVPRTVPSVEEVRLTSAELQAAVLKNYPEYSIVRVSEPGRPERPVHVALERDGRSRNRLFDPYTGQDMGDPYPPVLRVVEWLVRLHDDLLAGDTGRKINGLGGLLVTALVMTGTVIWWPGRGRWPRSLMVRRSTNAPRMSWQLHSMLGFWSCTLLFIWALTGVYFAFPGPFEATINFFDPDPNDFDRPGDKLLLPMIDLHFGRFGGLSIRVLWTVLGLLPAALFVTGFIMWWNRVVRRRLAVACEQERSPTVT